MYGCVLQLQVKVTQFLAANRPGGHVVADFATFPSPTYTKVLLHTAFVNNKMLYD